MVLAHRCLTAITSARAQAEPLPLAPCCRNRKLNDWLGRIAITLYAYFDFDMLHKKHWEHHNFTGQPGKDPDFHRGNKNLLVWYGR